MRGCETNIKCLSHMHAVNAFEGELLLRRFLFLLKNKQKQTQRTGWIAFSIRPVKVRRVATKRVASKAISRNGKWHLNGEAFWCIVEGFNARESQPQTSHSNNCLSEYLRASIGCLNWYFWEDASKVEHKRKTGVNCTQCICGQYVWKACGTNCSHHVPLCQKIKRKCEILNAVEKNTVASCLIV